MDTSKAPATETSFGPVKLIETGVLNTGYAEVGPASGPEVLLLHGWPYDIHSFADVAPALARLRDHAVPLSRHTRNGQQAAVAVDVIALMDALGIETAILAGFDWGARSADVVAALWPDRCKAWSPSAGT
jgi:pimeloyl-ACP methyl ester carboxylesterase